MIFFHRRRDIHGRTPLHIAAYYGHFDLVNSFVRGDGDIFAKDSEGRSCLHLACGRGFVEVVKILLTIPGMMEKGYILKL